jgi:hypothetical protein
MEAGRELDALVAERVMKWGIYWADTGGEHREPLRGDVDRKREDWSVPEFSIDISAAWQVVEHLRAQGWGITISQHHDDPWLVSMGRFANLHTVAIAEEGDTAALAICRAALAARVT